MAENMFCLGQIVPSDLYKKNLERIMKRDKEETFLYYCPMCNKTYIKIEMIEDSKNYMCPICNEVLMSKTF